jgi:GNAT superfamily N-acetyltransferase
MMNFTIRQAASPDVPAMHAVRSKVRENRLSDPGRITKASYLPYIAAGSAWVAETDAGIAGFAALSAPDASVWALFVSPEAEGAGIGRALHDHMLESARDQGIRLLSLSTEDGSRAANFYERAGWTRAGITADGEAVFKKLLAT